MPCNSDYLDPDQKEILLSRVACLLDEIEEREYEDSDWNGFHPKVYMKEVDGDLLVSKLCSLLQKADVKQYSLEMQIWWRDHQKADKARLAKERKSK